MKKGHKIEQAARELEYITRWQMRPTLQRLQTVKRPVERNLPTRWRRMIELAGSLIRDAIRGSANYYAGFAYAAAILGDYHAMSEDADRKRVDDEQQ